MASESSTLKPEFEHLKPGIEALKTYCDTIREDQPKSKLNPGQFSIMYLISNLIELFMKGPTKGEAMGKDINSAEAMLNTALEMVKNK